MEIPKVCTEMAFLGIYDISFYSVFFGHVSYIIQIEQTNVDAVTTNRQMEVEVITQIVYEHLLTSYLSYFKRICSRQS